MSKALSFIAKLRGLLSVGADGKALIADSGQASGLNWTTVNNTQSAVQATTSGTSIDFTAIPSGVKKIVVALAGVSLNAATELIVQIGDAGGVEASGYLGAAVQVFNASAISGANPTGSWCTVTGNAAAVYHGEITLTLLDASTFTWVCTGRLGRSDGAGMDLFGGSKSLSAVLDRVRLTSGNGTATFDAGKASIQYEF